VCIYYIYSVDKFVLYSILVISKMASSKDIPNEWPHIVLGNPDGPTLVSIINIYFTILTFLFYASRSLYLDFLMI
jgi:hypothetical protein